MKKINQAFRITKNIKLVILMHDLKIQEVLNSEIDRLYINKKLAFNHATGATSQYKRIKKKVFTQRPITKRRKEKLEELALRYEIVASKLCTLILFHFAKSLQNGT